MKSSDPKTRRRGLTIVLPIAMICVIALAGFAVFAGGGLPGQWAASSEGTVAADYITKAGQAPSDEAIWEGAGSDETGDAAGPEEAGQKGAADTGAGDASDPYAKLEKTLNGLDEDTEYEGFLVKLKSSASKEQIRRIDEAIAQGAHLTKLDAAEGMYTADSLGEVSGIIDASALDYIEPDYMVYMAEDDMSAASADAQFEEVNIAEEVNTAEEVNIATDVKSSQSAAVPNDPLYENDQYNMRMMHAGRMWSLGLEGQDLDAAVDMDENGTADDDDIVIAIIDSGLREGHEDLDADRIVAGRNFYAKNSEGGISAEDTDDTDDTNGHGTFVAGIIAAKKNNGVGIAGALQSVRIMPLRIFGEERSTTTASLVDAVSYAAKQRQQFIDSKGKEGTNIAVINMSLGLNSSAESLEEACSKAMEAGILLVCAAGNGETTEATYPAQYSMGVGSVTRTGAVARSSRRISESNGAGYRNKVWVCAPGDGIKSLKYSDASGYDLKSGTSLSCPEVAALGAVCKGLKNDLTQKEFMYLLRETAVSGSAAAAACYESDPVRSADDSAGLSDAGGEAKWIQDVSYGWGVVDYQKTVERLMGIQAQGGNVIQDESWEESWDESLSEINLDPQEGSGSNPQSGTGKDSRNGSGTDAVFAQNLDKVCGVTATANLKKKQCRIRFSPVAGAADYQVSWRKKGGAWKSCRTGGKTSVMIRGLRKKGLYEFRVRACGAEDSACGAEGSAFGPYSSVCRQMMQTVKVKKSVRLCNQKLTVKWSKASGATGYQVIYSSRKDLKNAKVKTVGKKKTSCSFRRFKGKKNCYFCVRPIHREGSVYAGIPSSILRVTIK